MRTGSALASVLDIRPDGPGAWLGHTDGVRLPQLFGGQLVGQSIVAAGNDVPDDRLVHSIHTSFLRPGRSDLPIRYEVQRLRDGRRFSSRVVDAVQDGRLVCRSTVSCAVERPGLAHSRPRPVSAPPAGSVDLHDLAAPDGGLGDYWEDFATVDIRVAPEDEGVLPASSAAPLQNVWMRVVEDLDDDPLLHRAAIAYASDLMLMSMAVAPHGHVTGHERSMAARWNAVSLDHTIWFHRDARADDWMLFEHASPTAAQGRVLIEAAVFGAEGDQIAHVAQEAFVSENEPDGGDA